MNKSEQQYEADKKIVDEMTELTKDFQTMEWEEETRRFRVVNRDGSIIHISSEQARKAALAKERVRIYELLHKPTNN